MSKKDQWIAADGTTGQKDSHTLSDDLLQEENQLAIQRLILKLTYRSYNVLDRNDIGNLANLIRSTKLSKDATMIYNTIERNNLDCQEVNRLICEEYGIQPYDC